ncbi:MAG: hypothetical protein ACE5MI_00485 [Acidimicrobiia bacterium]
MAALALSACFPADPPWMDSNGEIVSGSLILEYQGFVRCQTREVTFLRFFDRQYADDPEGQLGPLRAIDGSGRVLTFEVLEAVPPGALPSGFHRGDREIYVDRAAIDDYLYVVHPSHVERWPRAEIYCEP